jgi:hypothetical protein
MEWVWKTGKISFCIFKTFKKFPENLFLIAWLQQPRIAMD